MRKVDRPLVQLATRIPAHLRRRAKLAAVAADMTLQDFVVEALEEYLARMTGSRGAHDGDGATPRSCATQDDGEWRVPPPILTLR